MRHAPLLRVHLLQLSPERNLLLLDMHHIISDGVSMGILVEEFTKLYAGEALPELRIQYKDYAEWQLMRSKSEEMEKQAKYWMEMFAGELPVLQLPMDYPRPVVQRFEGNQIVFRLDKETTDGLYRLAEETGSTLYMVMLAAYSILLSQYSGGQEDIVVGSPIAGRPHADLTNVIGLFVNTLALRIHPSGEKTFVDFLDEVKQLSLLSYEHQEYPFEMLVERLDLPRDVSRNPLFDTMFALQNVGMQELEIDGLYIKPYESTRPHVRFDLMLSAEEREAEINCELEYNKALFRHDTVEELAETYRFIIHYILENKYSAIKKFHGIVG